MFRLIHQAARTLRTVTSVSVVCVISQVSTLTGCTSTTSESSERTAWVDAQGRSDRSYQSSDPSKAPPAATLAPVAPVTKPALILISDFQIAHPSSTQDGGGRPRLLPGVLRGARSELTQSQLVSSLASKIVSELERRNIRAERRPSGALPRSGWLVQGTFVESVRPDGTFVTDRWAKQDVELTIVIDDLVRGRPEPLTDFTVTGDASGVGAPMMPNPYAAGAKFVVRQTELEGDVTALAGRVADAIVRFAQSEHVLPGAAR